MIGNRTSCPCPPVGTRCNQCGYYEDREVTKYYLKKDRMIRRVFGFLVGIKNEI